MLGAATGVDEKAIIFFGALQYCLTMDSTLFTPWTEWPLKLRGDASKVRKGVRSIGLPDVDKRDVVVVK